MRPGVRPGEGYLREVASHLLDQGGFAGVPATTVVEARHPAFHYPVRCLFGFGKGRGMVVVVGGSLTRTRTTTHGSRGARRRGAG